MKKSFTLIELIVVIAIIAILAAIIAPNAFKAVEKAKISEAIADVKTYKTAIGTLYADTGHWVVEGAVPPLGDIIYPDSANNDLITNLNGYFGWDGPYVQKIKAKNPWKGWYVFQSNDVARGLQSEIWLDFEDACYPLEGSVSLDCPIPDKAKNKIDATIDDGDPSDGNVQEGLGGSAGDFSWFLVWDAY
ncbi:MAG: type II secretion system protein GspG [Candidatus Omnitrophica bacterium]|nr:type II secretion system protein GspG [Candidatus Omnitrophota bacterium]